MYRGPVQSPELVLDFGHEQWSGRLFLPETVGEVITMEHIQNVLNDSRQFVPVAVTTPPFVWLVNKQHIIRVQWSFQSVPEMEKHVTWDQRARVRLQMYPERAFHGYLIMTHLREGQDRVQDFLNLPGDFATVVDHEHICIWFVNKRWILRIGHFHE